VLEREVEALELEAEPQHPGVEHADRLFQQFLARLVALEHDDLERRGHGAPR
jgi:hypothetical protein